VDYVAQMGFAHVAKMRMEDKLHWRKSLRSYLASIDQTKLVWSKRATLDDWRKMHIINYNDGGEGK
jgi:hypothetical protein